VPTYQYACTACGEQLEAVQAFTDAPLTECPACSGRLRKVFSAVGVVFKGSGFYKTDSRATAGSASKDGGSKDGGGGKEGATPAKTGSAPAAAKSDGAASSSPVAKSA
jgi:putative FmdB family regulatory protein